MRGVAKCMGGHIFVPLWFDVKNKFKKTANLKCKRSAYTAFMTGCSNAKSWLSAESSVDDRLRPCKHISLKSQSRIFTVGLSARVRAEREHLEPADALPVTKDVNQRVVLSRLTAGLVSSVCLLLFDRQPLNVQIRSQALIRQTTRFKLQRYF